jgi:hypothetical protein
VTGDGQKPITTIRFPPGLIATVRRISSNDGMTVSAWIRRLVDQEIGRRDGKCPTCGQIINDEPIGDTR